jgi:hypothetical protein
MTLFIVVTLSVLTMGVAAVLHRRVVGNQPDLGWVSERWLAEYRADVSRPPR